EGTRKGERTRKGKRTNREGNERGKRRSGEQRKERRRSPRVGDSQGSPRQRGKSDLLFTSPVCRWDAGESGSRANPSRTRANPSPPVPRTLVSHRHRCSPRSNTS